MNTAQTSVAPPGDRRARLSPTAAFGLCVALLASTAALVHGGSRLLGLYLTKQPVPLRKPLDQLDKTQLAPYVFKQATVLPEDMVKALDTRQYIQWVLEDPGCQADDPLRYPRLFVSYYTGGRERVPHTAERCYLGSGFEPLDGGSSVELRIRYPGDARPVVVSATVQPFRRVSRADTERRTVVYTFYANCTFTGDRNYARLLLSNPWVPKAFFSKVEVTFAVAGPRAGQLDAKQAVQAAERLLQTVLPILVRDHWPRWEDVNTGAGETTG